MYFQVHKFSKHALSNCSYWQDAKNLDHINLEDILADADKEGIHVILDDDDDERGYVKLDDDEFEEMPVENYIQKYEADGTEESYEVVEDPDELQYEPINNSHDEDHYEYVNQSQYEPAVNVKQDNSTSKKAIFNLNLGEFTVDEDHASNSVEFQNSDSHR